MKRFAIHGRILVNDAIPHFEQLIDMLKADATVFAVSEVFNYHNPDLVKKHKLNVYHPFDESIDFDVVLSIGGDGTFLESLTHVGKREHQSLG